MKFYKSRTIIPNCLFLLCFCLCLSACHPYKATSELSLLELHNQARQDGVRCNSLFKSKAPELIWNSLLAEAAYRHSLDMYSNKRLSHIGSNNESAGQRLDAIGYRWKTYAENIAVGVYDDASVFELWLNSAAHCKNIINASYTQIGAAQVNGYWTAIYARP